MDNQQNKSPLQSSDPNPAAAIGFQLRKGFDRISFEADRLMRTNRIKAEANRLKDKADEKTFALGRRLVDMSEQGTALEPELQALVSEIKALEVEQARKRQEVEAVINEAWVAPPAPVYSPPTPPPAPTYLPPGPPQSSTPMANTAPTQQETSRAEARECPVCQASIRPGAAFCANCGYKLAP